ncbi:MAG: hypothetical protein K0U64_03695 [Actinomycetia bacterium]|nr:hypothetical protein [Actinomycetes bacterium]
MANTEQHPYAGAPLWSQDPAREDIAVSLGMRIAALLAVAFLVLGIWAFSSAPVTTGSNQDVTTSVPQVASVANNQPDLQP